MPEFRVDRNLLNKERELSRRLLSWGLVALLFAITVLLFCLGISGYLSSHSALRFLFVFTLLAAVVAASILASGEALRIAERQMVFALDEEGITRRRKGWPDVTIAFSEIDTLREELRWLVIYGGPTRKKIAIPKNISGYEKIRAELARRHPLSVPAEIPLSNVALSAIAVLSWSGLIWFGDARIAVPCGFIALGSLAIGSRRLWTLLHLGPKRVLMWFCLASAWILAIFLIYIRAVRP
ncbi:MAG: hypothetical protein ROO76_19675 [Terriglobia bacterium]|nr:hypothetical protein [Terriglobia bacterium]